MSFVALPALLIIAAIAFMIVFGVSSYHANKRRKESMAEYAHARGWSYEDRRPELARRVGLASPAHGDHVIEGQIDGRPFVAFDHVRYENDGDNGRRSIPTSVVVVNLGVPVPELEMSRQGAISRFFTDLFGTDHLVGDKVFDDAVRIKTNSAPFTAEVLTIPIKQLLLARLHRSWRFTGDNLLTVADGKHSPAELEEALASCAQLIGLIPPHVWARLQAGATPSDAGVTQPGAMPVAPPSPPPAAAGPATPRPVLPPSSVPPTPTQPTAAPSRSLEESVGWSVDPITGKRTDR